MKRILIPVLLLIAMLTALPAASAKEAQDVAADPLLEARVMKLAEELRCLVCQNQTIADSHAELAIDLKNQVREQLKQGRSEKEVADYMVQRYGDFVLYRPPVKATTLLLWAGPFVLLLGAAAMLLMTLRQRKAQIKDRSLSQTEHQEMQQLLQQAQPNATTTPNTPTESSR